MGCNFAHNPGRGFTGENLAVTVTGGAQPTAQESLVRATELWYEEVANYTFSNPPNDCDPGAVCGHYTQVNPNQIWKIYTMNTNSLRCLAFFTLSDSYGSQHARQFAIENFELLFSGKRVKTFQIKFMVEIYFKSLASYW